MPSYTPLIERDDVQQEAEMLLLQGKRPNRGIIRKKLERLSLVDLELDLDTWEERIDFILFGDDEDAVSHLGEWADDQVLEVQECIDAFLADPEALLEATLRFLGSLHLLKEEVFTSRVSRKAASYASIMLRALPCTKDELITLMTRFPIKRPASTVRQFLRRHSANLKEDELGHYHRV